ncbi:MAG: hypothetical protein ACHQNA_14935, partial [Acidimicrobiales bacterium]
IVVACAAAAALIGWEVGRPAHHSSPSASSTLLQAIRSMQAATDYHFSGQVAIGIEVLKLSGEFSAPDHLHETLTLGGGSPVERVIIGPAAYQRSLLGWQRVAGASTAGDPRSTFTALAGAAHVKVSGSVYSFDMTGPNAAALISGNEPAATVSGTVTVQSGQIVSLTYTSPAGAGTTVAFAYSGVGTTPPVTAPPGVT